MPLPGLLVPGVLMGGGTAAPPVGDVSRVFITDTYDRTTSLTGSGGSGITGSGGRSSVTGSGYGQSVTGGTSGGIGGSYDG